MVSCNSFFIIIYWSKFCEMEFSVRNINGMASCGRCWSLIKSSHPNWTTAAIRSALMIQVTQKTKAHANRKNVRCETPHTDINNSQYCGHNNGHYNCWWIHQSSSSLWHGCCLHKLATSLIFLLMKLHQKWQLGMIINMIYFEIPVRKLKPS